MLVNGSVSVVSNTEAADAIQPGRPSPKRLACSFRMRSDVGAGFEDRPSLPVPILTLHGG